LNRGLIAIILTVVVALLGFLIVRLFSVGGDDATLVRVTPHAQEATPTPSPFTPVPPGLISRERVLDTIFGYDVLASTPEAVLLRAASAVELLDQGDFLYNTHHLREVATNDPEHPVWLVTSFGRSSPPQGKCCDPPPAFERVTRAMDAVDGRHLGSSFSDHIPA